VLLGLPDSQAGAGRHKCVVCAYQRGFEGASGTHVERCDHRNFAPVDVLKTLRGSQAGSGRHKCAVCAFAAGARATAVLSRNYPDELAASGTFPEGATKTVFINQYERNQQACAACIAHYGHKCAVCGLDFGVVYGAGAAGLIHVHHLRSLASIGKEYKVDPVRDLRPVCPNCHAVIHRGDPMHSIEDVRKMLAESKNTDQVR